MSSLEEKYVHIVQETTVVEAFIPGEQSTIVKKEVLSFIANGLADIPTDTFEIEHVKFNGTAAVLAVVHGDKRYTMYITADVAKVEQVAANSDDEDEENVGMKDKDDAAYEKALRTATNLATQYEQKGAIGKAVDQITGGAGKKAVQAVKQAGNLAVNSLQKQNQKLAQSLAGD